jgi:hypothetical protein
MVQNNMDIVCKFSATFCSPVYNSKQILYICDKSVLSYYIHSCSQDREGVNYRIKTALHHSQCFKDYIYLRGESYSLYVIIFTYFPLHSALN